MRRPSRAFIAVAVTLLLATAVTIYSAFSLKRWREMGMTGLSYVQVTPGEKDFTFAGIGPGTVMVVLPESSAEAAGIRVRDRLLSINGIALKELDALRALDGRLKAGDRVTYRFRRGGVEREVTAALATPFRDVFTIISLIVSASVAVAFIAIGIFVFTRKPGDRRVAVFYALVIAGAVSFLLQPALQLEAANARGILVDPQRNLLPFVIFIAAAMAFSPLALHLALVFPRERPVLRTSPRVLGWIYGVPAMSVVALSGAFGIAALAGGGEAAFRPFLLPLNIAMGAITLAGLLIALRVARFARTEGVRRAFWNRPVQSLTSYIALALGFMRVADALHLKWVTVGGMFLAVSAPFLVLLSFPVLVCVSLYRSYRESGIEERRQVKWPLWGTLIAIATKIVVGVVTQIGTFAAMAAAGDVQLWIRISQYLQPVPVIAALLIPISFAFAILKYRLMNIDVIIRKTVAYAFLSGAIIVLYLVLVGGLGTLLVNVAGVHNQTMVIASTLVVALLFVPLRNKLQTLVDRNLFRHKYDYPEALRAIGADTLTATDLNAFLAAAAEKTQQALQNRAVVIFVSRHDELVAAAKVGVADSLIGALRIRRAPLVGMLDRPFDPRRHALPDDAAAALKRVEAVLVVPINTPGTPANGFLALAPKLSGAELDVEDIDFLRSVADQIDIGIDRIRMQREDADYEQARAIQQTLLPREMPRVAGLELSGIWQPARTMGGDYYDLLKLGENELALCIGDVAGKGMSAALLMSGLQAAVRASASGSPRDLCERVRRVVVSSLAGGRFVTFFYGTIDTAAMRLRWCNAGHNAPILARADGSVVRLDGGGPAFSRLTAGDAYEERETAIAPGDRIVLFTDGVSEAGVGGELFGEQRLEELVVANRDADARALQQSVVEAATSFAGGELEDDLTLVVVAVTTPA